MTDDQILAKIRDIATEKLEVKADDVTLDANFTDDLGADSLDTVELVMGLEDAFGVEIPDEAAEKLRTVNDAVEYVKTHAAA